MALVNAATLVAELGDLSRFANARQLMAYLGLVPSEHSSGASVKRGGLTKVGNSAARRRLIEAAWCYRFPARVSRELRLRQEAQPRPIREIAWNAQLRLYARYRNDPASLRLWEDGRARVDRAPAPPPAKRRKRR